MIRRRTPTRNLHADLNLTSMSDLTFLLLIAFIITFPIIEQGIPVRLPKGTSEQVDPQKQSATVTVDKEGRIALGTEYIRLEDLRTALRTRLAENPAFRLIIRGDTDVDYGSVVAVARLANELGISRMSLATSGESN